MRLRARDILLLLAGWALVAAVLAVLFVIFRSRGLELAGPPTPAPTYTVAFTQVTALGLYPAAEGLARAWQPDARLVSLSATWRETGVNLVGQPTEWNYRFYSPAGLRYYLVTVAPGGQAQGIEHARPVDMPPPLVPVEAWSVDSVGALSTWLDYGGGAMLSAKPGIEVSAQLNVPSQGGEPVWAVVGYDTLYNDYLTVVIDAGSGAVLQAVRPPQ